MEESPFRLPRVLEIVLAIVVALELIAPFVAKTYGVDGLSQLNLVKEFSGLVARGVWVPRWVPEGFSGFGVASFYFYPPVSLYIASLVRILTGITEPRILFQITGLLATAASFFSARALLKQFTSSVYRQTIGALLYTFAPFRMAELYSRSSLSTHVAYAFVPLVWLALVLIMRGGAPRGGWPRWNLVLLLGAASALLALTSVPFAMVTAICILFAAVFFWRSITLRVINDAALGVIIALLLSASQLAAILSARPFARLEDLTVTDPEYIVKDLLHGGGLPAAYHVGLLYLAVLIATVLYFKRSEQATVSERAIVTIGASVALFIALLEIPGLTSWLWSTVPPFTIIQGMWRFYSHLILFGTLLVAIATSRWSLRAAKWVVGIWSVGALLPALLIVFNLHFFAHTEIDPGDPSEYRPLWSVARDTSLQTMRRHADDPMAMASLQHGEQVLLTHQTDLSQDFSTELSAPRHLAFHRFEWPFWHLYANGLEIESHPDSIGRASAVIPAGHTLLHWQLERTTLETIGDWVSGISWCTLLFLAGPVLLIRSFRQKQRSKSQ